MSRQRALSFRAAQECETARGPVCKCRCNGALHGAARVGDTRALPLDDPHSPSSPCPRCDGTGKVSWLSFNWTTNVDERIEAECQKCKGAGRILSKRTMRAPLETGDLVAPQRRESPTNG
jgi:DnaJ-class molecular chaperone